MRAVLVLAIILVFVSAGCTLRPGDSGDGAGIRATAEVASVAGGANAATATPTQREEPATQPSGRSTVSKRSVDEAAVIALGDPISIDGTGAALDGRSVRITAGGTYRFSGTLRDGQIVVEIPDKKTVKLVLDGVDITSSSSAPIYVKRAQTTTIVLNDGTENHLTDGNSYRVDDPVADEPDAAIFSKGNLTIDGNGSLIVKANYRNAINSKGELNITGGNLTVNAAKDGIRGRDHIAIEKGSITVDARADGMRSSNDEDPRSGFISIDGGNISVTAGEDGIQAETSVVIRGGMIAVSTGGGSASAGEGDSARNARGNSDTNGQSESRASAPSAKGISAVTAIEIAGGALTVDSFDDAIHSNGSITISDGKIVLASGDDGIHSDSSLTIAGGDTTITRSYEAVEGVIIAISGGSVHLVASDDGVNVADSKHGIAANGRSAGGSSSQSVDKHLSVEGGYVVVDATGDGLDINGWAKMTGGTVIVNGPVVSDNGALDYAREFTMAGGTLVAVGSFGMAQAPDATSTQDSLVISLGSPQPAGTLVHIEAEDGTAVLTFAPIRQYQSVVYSSAALKKGATYNVYIGGTATGSVVDGVYAGGSYTPGVRTARLKVSAAVSGRVS